MGLRVEVYLNVFNIFYTIFFAGPYDKGHFFICFSFLKLSLRDRSNTMSSPEGGGVLAIVQEGQDG